MSRGVAIELLHDRLELSSVKVSSWFSQPFSILSSEASVLTDHPFCTGIDSQEELKHLILYAILLFFILEYVSSNKNVYAFILSWFKIVFARVCVCVRVTSKTEASEVAIKYDWLGNS